MVAQESTNALVAVKRDELYYPLPEPAGYTAATSTMVDSGTSVSGHLLGAVVRENVAHISLSWKYLTVSDWADINRLFNNGNGTRYINTVRFFDQTTGEFQERAMYVSDRSAGMWRRNEAGDVVGWLDCSLELTEV